MFEARSSGERAIQKLARRRQAIQMRRDRRQLRQPSTRSILSGACAISLVLPGNFSAAGENFLEDGLGYKFDLLSTINGVLCNAPEFRYLSRSSSNKASSVVAPRKRGATGEQ